MEIPNGYELLEPREVMLESDLMWNKTKWVALATTFINARWEPWYMPVAKPAKAAKAAKPVAKIPTIGGTPNGCPICKKVPTKLDGRFVACDNELCDIYEIDIHPASWFGHRNVSKGIRSAKQQIVVNADSGD